MALLVAMLCLVPVANAHHEVRHEDRDLTSVPTEATWTLVLRITALDEAEDACWELQEDLPPVMPLCEILASLASTQGDGEFDEAAWQEYLGADEVQLCADPEGLAICVTATELGVAEVQYDLQHGPIEAVGEVIPPQFSEQDQFTWRTTTHMICGPLGGIPIYGGFAAASCYSASESAMVAWCADGRCDDTLVYSGYWEVVVPGFEWHGNDQSNGGADGFVYAPDAISRFVTYDGEEGELDDAREVARLRANAMTEGWVAKPPVNHANANVDFALSAFLESEGEIDVGLYLSSDQGTAWMEGLEGGKARAMFSGETHPGDLSLEPYLEWILMFDAPGLLPAPVEAS